MPFTALQHSPFLQSLGWAIINSLWQAAVLWLAYRLLEAIYRNATSAFRNNTSTFLLICIFSWFIYTFLDKFMSLSSHTLRSATVNVLDSSEVLPRSFNSRAILENLLRTLPFLSSTYLLLLGLLGTKLCKSYMHIFFIRKDGLEQPSTYLIDFTRKVSSQMGIQKKVNLWISRHVDVPATLGFFKPFILIPIASVNHLTTDQMEAVILHELSHIKRNDYLVNLLTSLIETFLFFNPFVLLLGNIMKKERENCCDDLVLQYRYDRHGYASALLSLEQGRQYNTRLVLAASSGKKQLLVRIKRIMEVNGSRKKFGYAPRLITLLLITGTICSISWLTSRKANSRNTAIQYRTGLASTVTKDLHIKLLYLPSSKAIEKPLVKNPRRENFIIKNKFRTAVKELIPQTNLWDGAFAESPETFVKEIEANERSIGSIYGREGNFKQLNEHEIQLQKYLSATQTERLEKFKNNAILDSFWMKIKPNLKKLTVSAELLKKMIPVFRQRVIHRNIPGKENNSQSQKRNGFFYEYHPDEQWDPSKSSHKRNSIEFTYSVPAVEQHRGVVIITENDKVIEVRIN